MGPVVFGSASVLSGAAAAGIFFSVIKTGDNRLMFSGVLAALCLVFLIMAFIFRPKPPPRPSAAPAAANLPGVPTPKHHSKNAAAHSKTPEKKPAGAAMIPPTNTAMKPGMNPPSGAGMNPPPSGMKPSSAGVNPPSGAGMKPGMNQPPTGMKPKEHHYDVEGMNLNP